MKKRDGNGDGVRVDLDGGTKPNSRVTRKHIEQLNEAMVFASRAEEEVSVKLGYLSFAVASVLRDVGLPEHYIRISARMWQNFGGKAE